VLPLTGAGALAHASATPAHAQYKRHLTHSLAPCNGAGPAVRITVSGVKASSGTLRVQLYRATKADWLEKGRWLNRIEVPARAGSMTVCMPVPGPGSYGIGVRHDVNSNGETDLTVDGGGASNNPSFNIFNLGKPSYDKAAFSVGSGAQSITIAMRYM
jgi:uncharacterized protein (DUF2141 family)